MNATFVIPKHLQANGGLASLIARLATFVAGEPWFFDKTRQVEGGVDGNDWQLGRGNDFFFHRRGPDLFEIGARYATAVQLQALRDAIVFAFGLSRWNPATSERG